MATTVAVLLYFTIFLLSFLAAREVVATRGLKGAIGLAVCWLALAAFFSYATLIAPFAPLNQLLSVALAQMVLSGAVLGLLAGVYKRWKKRT